MAEDQATYKHRSGEMFLGLKEKVDCGTDKHPLHRTLARPPPIFSFGKNPVLEEVTDSRSRCSIQGKKGEDTDSMGSPKGRGGSTKRFVRRRRGRG